MLRKIQYRFAIIYETLSMTGIADAIPPGPGVEVGEDRGLLGVNTKVNTDKSSVRLQPWSLQVVF